MRVLARVEAALLAQRGNLLLWSPVCLALGIGLYFALPQEPERRAYTGVVLLAFGLIWIGRKMPAAWAPLTWALALAAAGFAVAGARAHRMAAPVLEWRYHGPIEGRVVGLDRSASDALRVTLDEVRLKGVLAVRRPARIRLSLHGDSVALMPGQRIMTTGHLSPPQGPVEPGGYDFRRHAWFLGLGATGYTRNPVVTAAPPQDGAAGLRVAALRTAISGRVLAVLPGDVGGFGAAVTTGDRSAISQDAVDVLRVSNLAHLLAISGLHMGLLAGFVYAAMRIGLSLVPPLALRIPVRKISALFALVAASGYLALSGNSVATERAFIMVAVMMGAVLVDRRAISLRAVAVAAIVVLCLRPESLLSPGFQMSFAATTALVAVFGGLRDVGIGLGPAWLRPTASLFLASTVAGLATAPIGAAHFNMLAHYGLLANVLSVPVMGAVVIPAAVLAVVLSPLGLEWVGLWIMGRGLNWILGVGEWVAGMVGARGFVASPPDYVLPVLALGALWLILWRGRGRWAGILPMIIALSLWGQVQRPEVLVADTGGLVGVMTEQGRALSRDRGSSFIATVWLENDGDGADQAAAAARWPQPDGDLRRFRLIDRELIHVTGKRAAQRLDGCHANLIVVSTVSLDLTGECDVFDPERLRLTGSLALDGGTVRTSVEMSGNRLWSPTRNPDRRLAKSQ
ncbi:ComEC family competence protein [Ruegeria sediminis]|uniref:ComEC family competence protein n=1 Tax=Ruegeria sediminis TaxID=2583820 RepID=A0ABY2X1J8_9RHOB|nr:ComEC/Rec2 family competence protein [Ruegeria sediminis]TMV08713.1 ComEC family competence protein [Ruegeria sediminis]